MNSRAAAATTSRRAKQDLVRLLFGRKYAGRGPAAHRKLDPNMYSYSELRAAYLEQVHSIHPDKFAHKKESGVSKTEQSSSSTVEEREDLHKQFVELQSAWDKYEKIAKMMKSVSKGDKADANFTMFGVGCSFSDSPKERELRSEITDQACRGWFSAGTISVHVESSDAEEDEQEVPESTSPLTDDDWFVSVHDKEAPEQHSSEATPASVVEESTARPRRTLVDMPIRRRVSTMTAARWSPLLSFTPVRWTQIPLYSTRCYGNLLGDVLRRVQEGSLTPEKAEELLRMPSPEETLQSFANLDHTRAVRTGFPEVVFAQGKTPQQLAAILDDMAWHANTAAQGDINDAASTAILATRVSADQYDELSKIPLENGTVTYHAVARIVSMKASSLKEEDVSDSNLKNTSEERNKVVVACAGTTDLPVAEEAAVTLEAAGCETDRIYDVGVAGLHRIVQALPRLCDPSVGCVIVCAGMDGALPSVVGGLVSVPVIACPTSVGYGAAFGGVGAMLTMLNSCAPGVGVVNIDNGFGAAALAHKIIQ